ncbi:ATP-binding protein [Kiritimatiella glycovorans]|uniref:ATP-binding protein n=1 Tax=Kiritimatiella glycovorans TaxID=1307763 RepID=UPI00191C50A3|nr:ATP-binding protein [Kiritimatiella glycovorans]
MVLINGARQTGKTTLVRALAKEVSGRSTYLTFDDAGVMAAVANDPQGFIEGLEGMVVLDEVQKAPEVFPAIKLCVDRDRRPGRFLLTGSANVLMLPKLSESLAGRMEIITLRPFSQGEQEKRRDGFVERLMSGKPSCEPAAPVCRADLAARVSRGGYPEALRRADDRRRSWFASYLTTVLQRDIRDLSHIEGLTQAPGLMALLAARSGSLLNAAEVSRNAVVPYSTLQRYLSLFETTFLIHRIPPWAANLGKRLVKSPKLMLGDTGLMTHLLNASETSWMSDPTLAGRFIETFVGGELIKQIEWSRNRPALLHYRTGGGAEVDFVLESGGRICGVEVKLAQTLKRNDFRGLNSLAQDAGARFTGGVLLYTGREIIPFGANLRAVPVSCLWQ